MQTMSELFQQADWKTEKHVPVIECPASVEADALFEVKVSLGKEVAHPNTTEKLIRCIQLFFKPDGAKFAFQVGNFEFCAHGESTEGANNGPVYTHHSATAALKLKTSGTLIAAALCNIHGLWENSVAVQVK